MRTIQIKIATLAFIGLAFIGSVQAQTTYNGDLIAGFSSGSGDDTLYDLGAASSLYNGETWDLSGPLLNNTSNPSVPYDLTSVYWGVVGAVSGANVSYLTYDPIYGGVGSTPPTIPGFGAWNQIHTAIKSMYNNFSSAGAGNSAIVAYNTPTYISWYDETISPQSGIQYQIEEGANPNTSGGDTVGFWSQPDNGNDPTQIGNFTLNSTTALLTYNTVTTTPPVPPAPKIVSIVRSGANYSIYFTTTNASFTYTLYYTNAAGIKAPFTSWATNAVTVTGNGLTNSITDTSTDGNRVYLIGVQ